MGARRMAIPCVERLGTVLIEDISVPIPASPTWSRRSRRSPSGTRRIPVIGHAGDGNLHPLVTFDASDADATSAREAAFDEIMDAALDLGGTVTGEHGIGTLKARHLRPARPRRPRAHAGAVKAAIDPGGILNPGKWV